MNDGEQYVTVQIDGAFRAMRESEARRRGLYPPTEDLVQRVRNLEALTELLWAHQENLIERVAHLEGNE